MVYRSSHRVCTTTRRNIASVPKLWARTVESHRQEVREAILDTTAALVAERGLRSVTMSEIAENSGIGRATLYKYFPDVDAIVLAWHERQIAGHLAGLIEVRDRAGGPIERLRAVLEAYALMTRGSRGPHNGDLAALLHRGEHVVRAAQQVRDLVRDVVTEGVNAGELRHDVPPDELATFCLSAMMGARLVPSNAAVRRLVAVTLDGLRSSR
jgi:AcrR family transcriptional regulator